MVDEVVTSVTGQPTVAAAWASLVKPSDIVGIKVCANGAPLFSTHPEVVENQLSMAFAKPVFRLKILLSGIAKRNF